MAEEKEFKTCPGCPAFFKKECAKEGSCRLKGGTSKGSTDKPGTKSYKPRGK